MIQGSFLAYLLIRLSGADREVMEKWLYVIVGLVFFAGILGTAHHYYWVGVPSYWLPIGGIFSALEPLVKKANDYYEQEDYKDDAAKGAQELHAAMMPLFQSTFAAERELRHGLDAVKASVDRRLLAEVEKKSGRKYEWHLRSFLLAAKALITLLPENAEAPLVDIATYKPRYAELEEAYNAFEKYVADNPEEVKKVMLASFVETAVKDFYTASKFLRRTLEAKKLDRQEYFTRVGEVAKTYNDLIQRTNSMR
jgi:hypothetical protein